MTMYLRGEDESTLSDDDTISLSLSLFTSSSSSDIYAHRARHSTLKPVDHSSLCKRQSDKKWKFSVKYFTKIKRHNILGLNVYLKISRC